MNKQQLPINNPCTQDWNTMAGGDRQRFCQVCDKTVHDLSAMTQKEAQGVLAQRRAGQRLCVRYSAGDDGEILFQRPSLIPAGLLLRTRQVALRATLAAVAVAAVVETPGCVPAGPVTGAVVARVAAEGVVEELAESGTCSISLEPLLPLSLRFHSSACAEPKVEPVEIVLGEAPALPEPPPVEPPPVPEPPPVQVPPLPPPRTASAVRTTGRGAAKALTKAAPKPSPPPHILMGDIAVD